MKTRTFGNKTTWITLHIPKLMWDSKPCTSLLSRQSAATIDETCYVHGKGNPLGELELITYMYYNAQKV